MNDLTIDDDAFRKKQMDKVVDGVSNLGDGVKKFGDYIDEVKKWNKLSIYISIAFFGIILLSLIGGIIFVGKNNIKDVFVNPILNRNILCEYNHKNITIKSFEELKYFQETINGKCNID